MVKMIALENFTVKDFDKVTVIRRATSYDLPGRLIKGDLFETDSVTAQYFKNEIKNPADRAVAEDYEGKSEEPKEEAKVEKNASKEIVDAPVQVTKARKNKTQKKKSTSLDK